MTRLSILASLAAGAALLSFGCTPTSGGGGGEGGDEPEEEGPVSSYDENGFPKIADDWEDYVGDGHQRRDSIFGFEMVDQRGNLVDFRQFLGYVVILDLSAEWCPPCRAAAETAQEVNDEMQAMGPSYYVQIVSQNMAGDPATQDTVVDWSTDFDLELPVLADEGEVYRAQTEVTAFPTYWVIRPDGTIDRRQSGALSDSQIIAWTEYLLEDEEDNLRHIPGWPDPDAEFE